MTRTTARAGRAAAFALLALTLWCAHVPDARAQGVCDSPAVRDYIADFSGARTQPPAAWQACIDSLKLDPRGDYRELVLRSFAAVRSRTEITRDPIDAERKLFQGSDRITITRDFLDPWRKKIEIKSQEQKFDSTFYRALLGSLGWIVIDRSGRLRETCVAPVERLKSALRAGPNWSAAESALLAFRDVPLWASPNRKEATLTSLGEMAASLSPTELRTACAAINSLPTDPAYWAAVSKKLEPQPVTFVVKVPNDCALLACQAAREWPGAPAPEGWRRVRQKYGADVSAARQRLDAARSALPGGADWAAVETRLERLSGLADRLGGAKDPNGRDMVSQIEGGLSDLNSLSRLTDDLEDLVAYRKSLRSLLAGDAARARAAVRERSNWARTPLLVAANVTAGYWEKGVDGRKAACGEGVLKCSSPSVAAELARIASLLELGDGALKP